MNNSCNRWRDERIRSTTTGRGSRPPATRRGRRRAAIERFGIWNRRPEFKAIASGCSEWLTDLLQMSSEVKVSMASTEEAARRAGIYPGEAGDLRRRYRLEWDGWER